MRLKANIGKPGEMQHRPEAITAAKEVVTGGRSGRGRVHQKLGGPPPRSKRRLRDHSALLKQIGEPGPPAAGIRVPRIVWAQAGWWDAPAAAWLAAQPQPALRAMFSLAPSSPVK